jgi:hypothetical protein
MARAYLVAVGVVFLFAYALPLSFAPLSWARAFRWREDRNLTTYFGRCTGVLATAVLILGVRAIGDPQAHREAFDLLILVGAGMTLLHVWGAIRRVQPWTEDVEIVLYALATAGACFVRP